MSEPTAALRSELLRLGAVAIGGVVACGWIAFSLNSKATAVALDSERRGTKAALDSNIREVEGHNGKIRQWEITQAQERATLATKADIAPLQKDYDERHGSAITASRFWGVIVIVAGFCLTAGAVIAKLPIFQ
jgi:hypothetical protein